MKNVPLLATFGAILTVALLYYAYVFWSGLPPSPDALMAKALSSAPTTERVQATLMLAEQGQTTEPQLRQILDQANDSQVKAAAIDALGSIKSWQSMPHLFTALESDSVIVRGRAAKAITRMMGIDFLYDPKAPPAARKNSATAMKKCYDQMNASPEARKALGLE